MKRKVSKKSKRRLITFGVLSMFTIGYFFVTIFLYSYKYLNLRLEEKKLNNELISLQDKKVDLKVEIEKLNDPKYVARYAKENFLYSSDGEFVIKLDENNKIQNENNNNFEYVYVVGIIIVILFLLLIYKVIKKSKIKKQ